MEARTAFRGSAISSGRMAVVVAVLAAFVLGGIGGHLVKALSLPASALAAHVVAGQPGASGFGSAGNCSIRRNETQSVQRQAPIGQPIGTTLREPTKGRSGPQS
jgi:hypothetical protein